MSTQMPRATYRLQLHRGFTFADAAALAPYLGRLGVSHAYLSPILMARPGSTHGYDMVDPARINPELGTLDDFHALAAALRGEGIGIVLDIVPNHMGIGGTSNPYWLDVLRHGQASRFAHWFDIDWQAPDPRLQGRVLVPFLPASLAEGLADGTLHYSDVDGEPAIWIGTDHKLPLDPSTFDGAPADAAALRALIDRQHWLPARFSAASHQLNYRRFFAVSDLAGLRIEEADVFDAVHAKIFGLCAEGLVDGLRIDHIDGLRDPVGYLQRLRRLCPRPVRLWVEKILAPHEQLPADWPVDGTTGYEALARILPVLTAPGDAIGDAHADFVGATPAFEDVEQQGKRDMLAEEFGSELDALARRFDALGAGRPRLAEVPNGAIRDALRELLLQLSVYRTYGGAGPVRARDRREFCRALARARRAAPWLDPAAFDVVAACLGDAPAEREALLRLQQLSGPVMAKGLEDTALYRAAPLLGLNDVGTRPDRPHASLSSFHDFCRARAATPGMLNAGSTHDSKRGEDARARLTALSGCAADWAHACHRWRQSLRAAAVAPIDDEALWYLLQTIFAAWPADWPATGAIEANALAAFTERVQAAMLKAVREARRFTRWVDPDARYEEAIHDTVAALLDGDDRTGFVAELRALEAALRPAIAAEVLIATTLRLTMPGIPDLYQGAEWSGQAMVDPDNRRPVDFPALSARLGKCDSQQPLRPGTDPDQKLDLVQRLLALRRDRPDVFTHGSYRSIEATGTGSDRLLAFERAAGEARVIVAAALRPWEGPIDALPQLPAGRWRDVLSLAPVDALAPGLFDLHPVAVLVAG